jgi:hypothetical protein
MDTVERDRGIRCAAPEIMPLNLGRCIATALLACEASKREISLLKVKLAWTHSGDPTITISHVDAVPFEDDRRSVTALEWIEPEGEQVRLSMVAPLLDT